MLSKKLWQLLIMCLIGFASFSQTRKITGVVTSDGGETLQGVTVKEKGKQIIVQSDANGKFSISVTDKASSVLVFSSVGYITKEVQINALNTINIQLTSSSKELDDIVVIGYGTQRKKDLTGSVSKVDIGDLQKAPVRSFEEALGGRVAGVQVTSADGQPGSSTAIVIRGNNSITQDNSPLYVIDGFPLENPNNNSVNPSDIESIEVLKDASATAIYGARGANGVILITTKKGKAGKTLFNFTSSYGLQKIINKIDVLSPYEFVRYQLELDSVNTKAQYLTGGKTVESYKDVPGIDWQEQVFKEAPMRNNAFSMSGGNSSSKFFLSLSALNQDGIVRYSGYDRYQGRFRFDQTINSKLKFGLNFNYSSLKSFGTIPSSLTNSSSQSSNLMFSVWGYRPNLGDTSINLLTNNDQLFEGDPNDSRYNPLETVKYEVRNRFTNTIYGNATLDYQLFKDLSLRTLIGYTNDVDRNEEFNSSKTRGGSPYTVTGRVNGVNGSILFNTTNSYVSENTLNYSKQFTKKSRLDGVAGFTFQGVQKIIFGAAATKLPNEQLGLNGLDEGTPSKVSSSRTKNTLASALARVNYNYDSRYLATLSFRADGSSKFSPSNKWSFFPSASFAWRLSQEKWLKNSKIINDAKLRTSFGLMGNNRVSDFAYLSTLNSPITQAYPFNGTLNSSTVPYTLGNPNLRWETTRQANIGTDLVLFHNSLNVTIDVYDKVTTDLLLNADLPPSSGFSNGYKNIGKVENKGLEITLNQKILTKSNFSWTTGFNIAFNRNKILSLNEGQEALLTLVNWDNVWRSLPAYVAKVGQPIGQFYGYIFDGIYQYSDFNLTPSGTYVLKSNVPSNTTAPSTKIQPGQIRYKDLNGDFIINDNDKTIIGNGNPNFNGGFTNNLKVGNFDLSVFFQFSYGGQLLNANKLVFEGNSGRLLQNQYATVLNRWTPKNPSNEMYAARGDGDKVYSSRVIEDGSYLRLKTVQIGYSMPNSLSKRLNLNNARLYVAAQNLYTWTKYSGFDPEVSAYSSALTPGFDYSVYPRARTITLGLNVNF
jgi:TonB-dependent starch-binding outer membrane protein SusC